MGGIDNQIMITRTNDYARDVSAALKRGDVHQEFLTAQQKAVDSQEPKKIEANQKPDETQLRFDSDGGSEDYYGDGGSSRPPTSEEKLAEELSAPAVKHLIDIKI